MGQQSTGVANLEPEHTDSQGDNTMAAAIPGTYEILRDGRPVATGLFKSADEILDFVRVQAPGVYRVYREFPRDPHGGRTSELWGEITNHGNGKISYHPSPPND